MHEDLGRRHDATPGSDRGFGFVMAAGCLLVALAPVRHRQPVRWWAIGLGVAFAVFALAWPRALRPLNAGWTRLGQVLNRVTSPILLALVFYVVVVPTGLLMRIAGRDPLRRTRDSKAASYWLPRTPAAPSSSMKQQF